MLTEDAIMLQLRHTNTEFRELEESHHRLDLELNELQRRHVLTPNEEIEKTDSKREIGQERQAGRIHSSVSGPTTGASTVSNHLSDILRILSRFYAARRASACSSYPSRQAAIAHHRGDDGERTGAYVHVFVGDGGLAESPIPEPAGILWADGSALCFDQGLVVGGGDLESAGHFLPVLEVH